MEARMIKRCSILWLFVTALLLFTFNNADASERNRFTAKPGSVFCLSLNAMHEFRNSLSRRDGEAASLLKNQECRLTATEVVVYLVHEENDAARVQLVTSGKYFWTSKQSLR
jgi:hypothetical protein